MTKCDGSLIDKISALKSQSGRSSTWNNALNAALDIIIQHQHAPSQEVVTRMSWAIREASKKNGKCLDGMQAYECAQAAIAAMSQPIVRDVAGMTCCDKGRIDDGHKCYMGALEAQNIRDASTHKDEVCTGTTVQGGSQDSRATSASVVTTSPELSSEIQVLNEEERYQKWRNLIDHLPDFHPLASEKPWVWSEDEIMMLRAACARRFDESLRTESLFCIAATGIRIYLSRTKPKPVSGEPVAYVRDLDGTGSLHICAKGDPGARGVAYDD